MAEVKSYELRLTVVVTVDDSTEDVGGLVVRGLSAQPFARCKVGFARVDEVVEFREMRVEISPVKPPKLDS